MANEISLSAALAASKGGVSVTQSLSKTLDMVGEDMITTTQIIATANTAVGIGAITSPARYIIIKNLDATNFVKFATDPGFAANTEFAKLMAGDVMLLPPCQAIHAKADTAVCTISVTAVEA